MARGHIKTVKKSSLLRLKTYAGVTAQKASTLLLIIFSVLLLIMGKVNENNLRVVKNIFTDLSSKVLVIIGIPVNSVTKAANQINSLIFLYTKNKNLAEENMILYKWKDLAQGLLVENEELRKLLNSVNKIPNKFLTAKVIANSSGSYIKTVTLNVGKVNSIKIGNAVINNWGMVGRVIQVGKKTSRVLLITDINSQIPIYFEKSKHKAILIGKNSDLLEIKFLKSRVFLIDNDRVFTSGEGGVLPRGLKVGTYIKSLNSDINKIKILPTRNWDRLDNLMIVLNDNKELY
ncbi:MAG: rod shape-determining protein MreC [Rickettsiales bacterium]|nr:rod shape-determining protein MreC [Rickettsiales bacterium]